MQALSDKQQMAAMESKVDRIETKVDGLANENRAEFRAVRAEIGGINRTILAMWLTMILGFAAILLQHHF